MIRNVISTNNGPGLFLPRLFVFDGYIRPSPALLSNKIKFPAQGLGKSSSRKARSEVHTVVKFDLQFLSIYIQYLFCVFHPSTVHNSDWHSMANVLNHLPNRNPYR